MALTVITTDTQLPLRIANESDVDGLRTLKQAVVDETWGMDHAPSAVDAWKKRFATDAYFVERLTGVDGLSSTFFIAGPRESPIGMAALKFRNGCAYVGDIYVMLRGQGIGTRLLQFVLLHARQQQIRTAIADVFSGNAPGLHLVQAHGFIFSDEYLEPSLEVPVFRFSKALLLPAGPSRLPSR